MLLTEMTSSEVNLVPYSFIFKFSECPSVKYYHPEVMIWTFLEMGGI